MTALEKRRQELKEWESMGGCGIMCEEDGFKNTKEDVKWRTKEMK